MQWNVDTPENHQEDTGAEQTSGAVPAPQLPERDSIRFLAPPSPRAIHETVGFVSELNRQGLIRQMARYASVVPLAFVVSLPRLLVRRVRPQSRR